MNRGMTVVRTEFGFPPPVTGEGDRVAVEGGIAPLIPEPVLGPTKGRTRGDAPPAGRERKSSGMRPLCGYRLAGPDGRADTGSKDDLNEK